ncbi:MAG: ribosome recycling factor [Clostridia bacterium]|nr:ribosome recycling factor [Clostridia bacterium]
MIFMELDERINKSVDHMKNEYNLMKAGRANPKLVEKILVDYYGAPTPINQMGNISVPEARLLVISLWDKTAIPKVSKAILAANIGVTPQDDGIVIRLVFPTLTQERRLALVKDVKKLAEEAKVAVRNCRRDAMDQLKAVKNSKTVSEDLIADYEKEVDKQVAKTVESIDKLAKEKEVDVLSV